jgi:putative holliday junction resolvase
MIGLDVGERRVGVAVCDPGGKIATPLLQLQPRARKDLVLAVQGLVTEYAAERVVVGMPLLLDGKRGEQARRTEGTVEALRAALPVPVVVWDERFSTSDAEAAMRGANLSAADRKARRDKVAAALILQSYLDSGSPL